MKYWIVVAFGILTTPGANAQTKSDITLEIGKLEQTVVAAILSADTNTLKKVWAPEFLVNNPRNTITGSRDSVLMSQRAGLIDYSSFERIIERIQVQENIVITMGYEVFISRRDIPEAKAGQPYRRRFTNIWMRRNNSWQQIARHASIICL